MEKENKTLPTILTPFGPRMLHSKLPIDFLNELNSECDHILSDEQKRKEYDDSEELIGHVKEELKCNLNQEKFQNFNNYLFELASYLCTEYFRGITFPLDKLKIDKPQKLDIHSAWYVRQFENDFNPSHIHTKGNLACIAYLKIPDGIKEKNTKYKKEIYTAEGYIDFIHGQSTTFTNGNLLVQPKVGDIFMFPSHLYHTVYPFFGDGERRSFSANLSL